MDCPSCSLRAPSQEKAHHQKGLCWLPTHCHFAGTIPPFLISGRMLDDSCTVHDFTCIMTPFAQPICKLATL
eukprot:2580860-Amphidinium_carterae.1